MTELGPEARRLLRLVRDADEPRESDERRVRRSLLRRLAVGASFTAAGVGAVPSAAALSLGVVGKTVVGVASLAVVFGTWHAIQVAEGPRRTPAPVASGSLGAAAAPAPASRADSGDPSRAGSTDAAPLAPVARTAVDAPSAAPMRPAPSSLDVATPAATAGRRDAPDTLREETASLRQAQAALRAGAPGQALALIEAQERRFTDGALAPERAAARILALCALARVDEAREQVQRFERQWPRSPLLARVRSACR
jgi:hypothetical protein